MLAKFSNMKASFKTKNTISEQSKTLKNETDTDIKSWEFMKKIDGLSTDFLNKQINIPSTAFTPNFTLPSKAAFSNIFFAYNVLNGIYKKISQVSAIFDKNSNASIKKEFIKNSIALSTRGFK
ncbi:MAG: hypothetical protein ACRCXX_14235 [Cetobacterium sp.]|uniref:hypothetical protein n=1 Tax=Cetobacterium sp. TaxID=2071632 RepID=UPI003F30F205